MGWAESGNLNGDVETGAVSGAVEVGGGGVVDGEKLGSLN